MKLLTDLGQFVIFDLTKVGTAYQIINSFVDDKTIHVFEISPVGQQAVLILNSKDAISLNFAYQQSLSLFRADILDSAFIGPLSEVVISAYLSQAQPAIQKNILVVEVGSFSKAFLVAKRLAEKSIQIIDFRAVRTCPPNLIITASNESTEILSQFTNEFPLAKITLIESIQKPLQSFFTVVI